MIPSSDTLRRASEILSQIGALQAEIVSMFTGGGRAPVAASVNPRIAVAKVAPAAGKKVRNMSPEARARIAAAARARWAKYRADKKGASK